MDLCSLKWLSAPVRQDMVFWPQSFGGALGKNEHCKVFARFEQCVAITPDVFRLVLYRAYRLRKCQQMQEFPVRIFDNRRKAANPHVIAFEVRGKDLSAHCVQAILDRGCRQPAGFWPVRRTVAKKPST